MYEIKVLDSEQFDEIARSDPRYSYVDETNMGFADRQRGIAYVRQTYLHDLNKFLINHELEELESDESTHEDPNGIRHKKFRDFFRALIPGQLFVQAAHKANQAKEEKKAAERQQSEMAQFLGSRPSIAAPQVTGPLGQFSASGAASPRLPDSTFGTGGGGIGAGTLGQSGASNLDPAMLERLKGFFSGRIAF